MSIILILNFSKICPLCKRCVAPVTCTLLSFIGAHVSLLLNFKSSPFTREVYLWSLYSYWNSVTDRINKFKKSSFHCRTGTVTFRKIKEKMAGVCNKIRCCKARADCQMVGDWFHFFHCSLKGVFLSDYCSQVYRFYYFFTFFSSQW